ncbi:MAG: hypothetical protein HYY02_06030 [Chloroflexi bacterium]|nr:hypothetical protein [Chloroflexota bacterium]
MYWRKSCPKCHTGDLALDRDIHGWYRQCIQCGYLQDLVAKPALAQRPIAVAVAASASGAWRAA